jgi:hypothetical protein
MDHQLFVVKLATGFEIGKVFSDNDLRQKRLLGYRDRWLFELEG